MPYTHLTPMERGQIKTLVSQGETRRTIAGLMGEILRPSAGNNDEIVGTSLACAPE